jgi:pimeloyl-ACP methyl ester carboxylesterase
MLRKRRLLFWAKIIVLVPTTIVFSSFLIANLVQYIDLSKFASREPVGNIVSVGDHDLHINCTGAGAHTVILVGGGGNWSMDWMPVQPKISEFAKVCSYDRAGFGWSEFGPEPRDMDRRVTELQALLENANLTPPFIMVGASLGGSIVQVFEHDYPELVSAMVLVDSRAPGFMSSARLVAAESFEGMEELAELTESFFDLGLLSAATYVLSNFSAPDAIPEEFKEYYLDQGLRVKNMAATAKESIADGEFDRQLQRVGLVGNKPLVIISHGIESMFSGYSDGQSEQLEEQWTAMQTQLTTLSTDSKRIVADKSGHLIQFAQPELIAEEVRLLAERI